MSELRLSEGAITAAFSMLQHCLTADHAEMVMHVEGDTERLEVDAVWSNGSTAKGVAHEDDNWIPFWETRTPDEDGTIVVQEWLS